jgi:hypothetical protein
MNKVPFSISWESNNFVYTASATPISLQGQEWVLGVMGRFTPYPEEEDAFCPICHSQKVTGELLLSLSKSQQELDGEIKLYKAFLPFDFCAGTFIRIQNEFSTEIIQLLSGEEKSGEQLSDDASDTLQQLIQGNEENLRSNIMTAFSDNLDHITERKELFCKDAIELPKNLYEALLRSIQRKGSHGYYLQKGLSELFNLINQHWPTFGVFWPSEVGAVGTAKTQGLDIIINLQLMEVHYRLAGKHQKHR